MYVLQPFWKCCKAICQHWIVMELKREKKKKCIEWACHQRFRVGSRNKHQKKDLLYILVYINQRRENIETSLWIFNSLQFCKYIQEENVWFWWWWWSSYEMDEQKNWRLSDKSSLLSVTAEGLKFGLTLLAYLAFVGRMWYGSWCTTKEKDYICLNIIFQCSTRGAGYIQVKGISNVSTVGQMDRTWESIHLTLIMTWNIFSSL